jgi:cytochrome c-type biogenesis protein CcmE
MVNRNLQVFGQAVVDTIQLNTQTGILTFDLTDGNNTVTIRHRGMVNNLRNSTEVVAIGEYRDGVFQAEKLLVKCPSKYEEIKEEG